MVDAEAVLVEELDRLVPLGGFERADWDDVVRRSGRGRNARAVVVGVAAVLLVAVSSAFALGHRPVIDFFSAKPGPGWAFREYTRGALVVSLHGRPYMFDFSREKVTLAARARQVTEVRYDGVDHELVVAPLVGGGYCFSWRGPYLGGSCIRTRDREHPLEASLPGDASGPIALYGSFLSNDGTKLVLRFQDGSSTEVHASWISPPIDAGFFLYKLSRVQRRSGHRPTVLTLLDDRVRTVASVPLRFTRP